MASYVRASSMKKMEKTESFSDPRIYHPGKTRNEGLLFDSTYGEWFSVTREGIENDRKPPNLVTSSIICPTRVEYVNRKMFDGATEIFGGNQSDPLFIALYPGKDPDLPILPIEENQIFSSRKIFRKLTNIFITPYLSPRVKSSRFFTKVQDFSFEVEKIHSKLILQSAERFDIAEGGYGAGLVNLLTTTSGKGSGLPRYEDVNCYRIGVFTLGQCNLIIKSEIDALDSYGNAVEIKCTKQNPRFPELSVDYYLNLWTQNVFGGTHQTRIGIHDGKGTLKEIKSLNMTDIQRDAQITSEIKKNLFQHIEHFLAWLRDELSSVTHGQAIVSYEAATDTFTLTSLPEGDFSLPLLSTDIRTFLNESFTK
eukprot:gene1660-1757_t